MLKIICAVLLTYFNAFAEESQQVIESYKANKDIISANLNGLTSAERAMALSIVAPEYSQFSKLSDFVELRTLYVMYLNAGVSDFSVGPFQMKPSFVEDMEAYVRADGTLLDRYRALLPQGSDREKRAFRLEQLSSWTGQLKYLEMFVMIAKHKTQSQLFATDEDRLQYWATLYNAGINSHKDTIARLRKAKGFPKSQKRYNYSEVASEFFLRLKAIDW